jgi:hypothetical protein
MPEEPHTGAQPAPPPRALAPGGGSTVGGRAASATPGPAASLGRFGTSSRGYVSVLKFPAPDDCFKRAYPLEKKRFDPKQWAHIKHINGGHHPDSDWVEAAEQGCFNFQCKQPAPRLPHLPQFK